jgi:hypothetical protein
MMRIVLLAFAILSPLVSVVIRPAPSAGQSCGSEQCSGDLNCDGQVTVDEILTAVNNALSGCLSLSADQACADSSAATCTKLDQCVLNATTVRYAGGSTCQARQKEACLARLRAPSTGNNPNAVEGCASSLPAAPCSEFDLGDIPECEAKIGALADGAPCTFSGQCQSANCAILNGTNCGTCAPVNVAGDSCATTSCSTGFTCVATTQQCQPRGALGNTCDTGHPCSAGLSCFTPAGTSPGTCKTAGSIVGAQCDPKHETDPGCDPNAGLYCDSTSKTCRAITYVTSGACGFVNGATVACTLASTCFGAQGQTPGTCKPNASDLMPCDTQAGPSCIPPARCVTGGPSATVGVCQLPDPTKCG